VNIVQRSGALPGFAVLLSLAIGASCAAAMTACSSGAGDQLTLAASGGGPLGGGPTGGDDASTSSPTQNPAPNEAAAPSSPEAAATEAGAGDVVDASKPPPVDSGDPSNTFTLIDTSITNVVLGSPVSGYDPIAESSVIDRVKVGTQLSIRVNTTLATVGSVGFVLDTTITHTENVVPYTLCSDNGAGVVTPCTFTVGKHVLVVTPYSLANLGGTASATTTLYFEIVDGDAGAIDAGGG
jgi:hypothetical protein